MNLISTRNNQKSSNIRWEPFATSTPLKVVPSNVKVQKDPQTQLKISIDSQDLIRKLQKECSSTNDTEKKIDDLKQLVTNLLLKKRSCENLEFSSSSDEDSASEKSRPVIKLGLKNQTNSLLKSKKSEDEDVEIMKNKNTAGSNQVRIYPEKSKYGAKGSKQNINHVHNNNKNYNKKKKQDNNVNLGLNNLSLNEVNQILNEVNPGNVTNDTKLTSEKEEDNEKFFKRDENFKHFSNCKLKTNKSGNRRKTCACLNKDSQTSKSLQDFGSTVIRKRKSNNIKQASNSVKVSQSKKAKNKLSIPSKDETKKNSMTSFLLSENKKNTSHQLFSESKVQELINTLNLTLEEVVETKESKGSFLQNKLTLSSLNLTHPSNHSDFIEKQNELRPRKYDIKNRRFIKKIHNKILPAADLEKDFQIEKNSVILKENNEHIQESQKRTKYVVTPGENFVENNSKKDYLNYKNSKRKEHKKAVNTIKKERKKFAFKQGANDSKNSKINNNDAGSSSASENVKSEKLQKPLQFIGEETTGAEKLVFKLINDLSYSEDETGCSARECWNVNTFKCGVFRLRVKSQMNCRTLHSNSHLGGVLIKGNLRMKIGSKELDLQPGDMAFVPPLTDWQATNIGECESVFYYWCGRFKT